MVKLIGVSACCLLSRRPIGNNVALAKCILVTCEAGLAFTLVCICLTAAPAFTLAFPSRPVLLIFLSLTTCQFRDMDAFMHLIRIRDGSESLSADVDLRSGDPGDQGQGPVEERALDA